MESLFDLLFTLIPISLFIALRVMGARKKKAAAEQGKLAQFLAAKVAPSEAVAQSEEGQFSAHDLIPDEDDEEGEAPHLRFVRQTPVPIPVAKKMPLPDLAQKLEAADKLKVTQREEADKRAAQASEASHQAIISKFAIQSSDQVKVVRATENNASTDQFFKRLENYSPLQRAVIMAEVLGEAKGM